jgi:hypothetical protein
MRSSLHRLSSQVLGRADQLTFPEAASAGEHWQRRVMNEAIGDHIATLDPQNRTAAEISGDTHANRGWKSYTSLDYPEFDLIAPLEEERRFDVVICEQVLEHVADPCAGAENLRLLCKPGGSVIVSTPFLIRIHELPMYGMRDYWRFTPRGLQTLLERAGLEVEHVGTWGNRQCVVGNFRRWSAYRPWHSMRDDPELPVQVWAFARAPG